MAFADWKNRSKLFADTQRRLNAYTPITEICRAAYKAGERDGLKALGAAWNRRAEQQVPEGWKLLKDTTQQERSYPEDSGHENGSYMTDCCHCGRTFIGHKRRVVCKSCATPINTAPEVK